MEPRLGIYIAGPMRGIPEWNFPAFHRVHEGWAEDAETLLKVAWFCPACQDEQGGFRTTGMSGGEDLTDLGFDLRRALGKDLAWIAKHADVVIVLPGWENSKGAQAEVALAHALDIIVTAYDEYADGFGPVGFVPPHVQDALWVAVNDYGYQVPTETEVHPEAPKALADGEVRTTSATGGQKGKKPQRFELIPAGPLWLLAELYGRGAEKYEDRNWERGYPWSLSYGAALRHMAKFWMGEDYDAHTDECPEDCNQHTGLPHPICAVFHMFGLTDFLEHHNEFDDRPIR